MDVVVNHDYSNGLATVKLSKTKSTYTVFKKKDNTPFFSIKVSEGPIPSELSGHFSSIDKAVTFIKNYWVSREETQATKNDRLHEERQVRKANASASNTESN